MKLPSTKLKAKKIINPDLKEQVCVQLFFFFFFLLLQLRRLFYSGLIKPQGKRQYQHQHFQKKRVSARGKAKGGRPELHVVVYQRPWKTTDRQRWWLERIYLAQKENICCLRFRSDVTYMDK